MANNVKYDTPKQFHNIVWKYEYNENEIDAYNLYHPVKKYQETQRV